MEVWRTPHTGKPGHAVDKLDMGGHGMDAGTQEQLKVTEDAVWLTVPPFSEYLRTVRLVAADAAGRAGLDYDEIEDFRIAVDELCHLLMSSTDHEIAVSFGVAGTSVVARGRAQSRAGSPLAPLNDLSRAIIISVSDHHELRDDGGELGFVVMKESRTAVES
jgi:hypothetical protein